MLPASQVVNGQAEVTYVLNNQSVAARLEPSQQSPLRAELKCMREMVPPIGFEPTTPALRMLATHNKINNLNNMLYSLLYSKFDKLS